MIIQIIVLALTVHALMSCMRFCSFLYILDRSWRMTWMKPCCFMYRLIMYELIISHVSSEPFSLCLSRWITGPWTLNPSTGAAQSLRDDVWIQTFASNSNGQLWASCRDSLCLDKKMSPLAKYLNDVLMWTRLSETRRWHSINLTAHPALVVKERQQ